MTRERQHGSLPRARRELGQCFLTNQGVRDKILAALDPSPTDWVVEIGPGPGVLTSPLTERAFQVVAVELDSRLAKELGGRVARPDRLEVVRLDAAEFDYKGLAERAGSPLLVVGNLPFNAAAPILRHALTFGASIERLVLMFQREVTQRLVATPGRGSYGLLSVVTQQRAQVTKLFDVAPGSFLPRPKVSAGVLLVTPRQDPLPPCCLLAHDLLLRNAFAHRRKTLRNNLRVSPWPWEQVAGWLEAEGIRPEQRAEEVSVLTWARLAARACGRPHHVGGDLEE